MAEGLANPWWALVLLGVCAGVLSGALGVGSGLVIIPGLVLLLSFPQKSAQGVCLAVMAPMVFVGAIRYKMNGQLNTSPATIGLLVAGAVVGAFVGVELAKHLPASLLRKAFAIFLVFVAIKMFLHSSKLQAPDVRPSGGRYATSGTSVHYGDPP